MATRTFSLTLFGQGVTGLAFSIGESVLFSVAFQDPATRLPVSGGSATLSIAALDIRNLPLASPVVSKSASIDGAGNGSFQFAKSDTASLAPGVYVIDCVVMDGGGNRMAFMPASRIALGAAVTT